MSPLLHRVASGDQEALREAISRYGPLLWSLARRGSVSDADAEDATQEIFLDVWRAAARFDVAVTTDVAFVASIARRRLIDRRRGRRHRPDAEPFQDPPTIQKDASAGPIESCGEAVLANKALSLLPPEQRTVLLLAACHGMSHEEIAAAIGMSVDSVKTDARRGLIRVRELLSDAPTDTTA